MKVSLVADHGHRKARTSQGLGGHDPADDGLRRLGVHSMLSALPEPPSHRALGAPSCTFRARGCGPMAPAELAPDTSCSPFLSCLSNDAGPRMTDATRGYAGG